MVCRTPAIRVNYRPGHSRGQSETYTASGGGTRRGIPTTRALAPTVARSAPHSAVQRTFRVKRRTVAGGDRRRRSRHTVVGVAVLACCGRSGNRTVTNIVAVIAWAVHGVGCRAWFDTCKTKHRLDGSVVGKRGKQREQARQIRVPLHNQVTSKIKQTRHKAAPTSGPLHSNIHVLPGARMQLRTRHDGRERAWAGCAT